MLTEYFLIMYQKEKHIHIYLIILPKKLKILKKKIKKIIINDSRVIRDFGDANDFMEISQKLMKKKNTRRLYNSNR